MVFEKADTRYVSLMVTHSCNLQCTYCYEKHKDGGIIDIEKAKHYLSDIYRETRAISKFKAIEFSFMGGEPLLEFDTIKSLSEWIWSQSWDIPYIIFVSTNGTLLNEVRQKWFKKNKDRIVLGISVDGSTKSQSTNRGRTAACVDLDFFIKTWPEQGIKCTISRETLPNLAEDIKWLHMRGFNKIYANLAFGLDWQNEDLTVYIDQLHLLSDFYIRNPHIQRCSLLDIDLPTAFDFSGSPSKYCGCGEGTLLIDIDGARYPCPVFSPISMTKEQLDGIQEIDFSQAKDFVNEKCQSCVLHKTCPKCYATNYLLTSQISKQPSFLCKAFKLQFIANCELHERLIQEGQEELTEQLSTALDFTYTVLSNNQINERLF